MPNVGDTISIPGGFNQACPAGYVKSGDNSFNNPVNRYTYCSYVGAPAPAPVAAPAPAPAKVITTTTVAPVITVNPQISPIFQQQFQPSNSPATAGTTQNTPVVTSTPVAAPASDVQPVAQNQSPLPVQAPAPVASPVPVSIPAQLPSTDTGNYVAPVTEPVTQQNSLTNYLPWIIAIGIGIVALSGNEKRKRR